MFSDLQAPFVLGLIAVMLLSVAWHEAAHAWMADRLGDPTARNLGRITLNPLKHLDPFLSVVLPTVLLIFGAPPLAGGKPVPINVANFRHRSRDFMLVALAGPFSNLLLAAGFGLLYVLCVWMGTFPADVVANPYGPDLAYVPSVMDVQPDVPSRFWIQMGLLMNIGLALFNLIPVPPLDGSRVVGWLLPSGLRPFWYRLDRLAIVFIVGLYVLVNYVSGAGNAILHAVVAVWWQVGSVVDGLARAAAGAA